LKDASFTIAEGCFYQLRISFYVQREIVTGLKYLQQSYRAGIRGIQADLCAIIRAGHSVFFCKCFTTLYMLFWHSL